LKQINYHLYHILQLLQPWSHFTLQSKIQHLI